MKNFFKKFSKQKTDLTFQLGLDAYENDDIYFKSNHTSANLGIQINIHSIKKNKSQEFQQNEQKYER